MIPGRVHALVCARDQVWVVEADVLCAGPLGSSTAACFGAFSIKIAETNTQVDVATLTEDEARTIESGLAEDLARKILENRQPVVRKTVRAGARAKAALS